MLVERALDTLISRCDGERPWLERVTAGLELVVELCVANPELARAAVVEVAMAGAEARRLHWNAVARFADSMAPNHELAEQAELPVNTALMSAGAVAGMIFDQLLAGRASELPKLLPDLKFALLVPYIGPHAATEEMWRVSAGRAEYGASR